MLLICPSGNELQRDIELTKKTDRCKDKDIDREGETDKTIETATEPTYDGF